MTDKKDHTVLIVICVLLGVVLTISVAIIGSVYNNNQNIERDKYLFAHCQNVGQQNTEDTFTSVTNYKCAK